MHYALPGKPKKNEKNHWIRNWSGKRQEKLMRMAPL